MGWQDKNLRDWVREKTGADRVVCRASSTSVVIAKSSDSRMARPKAFSSSERTHVGSPGRRCSGGSTRRVSLRLVAQEHLSRIFAVQLEVDIHRCNKRVARKMTTHSKSVEDGTNADISLYLSTRDITHACT
jgi:hypothetical protein